MPLTLRLATLSLLCPLTLTACGSATEPAAQEEVPAPKATKERMTPREKKIAQIKKKILEKRRAARSENKMMEDALEEYIRTELQNPEPAPEEAQQEAIPTPEVAPEIVPEAPVPEEALPTPEEGVPVQTDEVWCCAERGQPCGKATAATCGGAFVPVAEEASDSAAQTKCDSRCIIPDSAPPEENL